jgi:hypothetical protein
MNESVSVLRAGVEQEWVVTMAGVPKFLMFVVILVAGYFLAKLLCKLDNRLLERLGFDRLDEHGGGKRVLSRTGWDASDILCRLVFGAAGLFYAILTTIAGPPSSPSAVVGSSRRAMFGNGLCTYDVRGAPVAERSRGSSGQSPATAGGNGAGGAMGPRTHLAAESGLVPGT